MKTKRHPNPDVQAATERIAEALIRETHILNSYAYDVDLNLRVDDYIETRGLPATLRRLADLLER